MFMEKELATKVASKIAKREEVEKEKQRKKQLIEIRNYELKSNFYIMGITLIFSTAIQMVIHVFTHY